MKLIFVLTILIGLTAKLSAQDQNYTHFNLRSGIASGYINEIIEDRYGFIWIATLSGMSRFDGHEFVNYTQKAKDSLSLRGSSVTSIIDYDEKTLIVSTVEALNVYDRLSDSFKLVLIPDSIPTLNEINSVIMMDNSDLWVLSKNGLYHITEKELMSKISKVGYFPFPKPRQEGNARIGSLLFDGKETIWFGSTSQSLQRFNVAKKEFVPIEVDSDDWKEFNSLSIWDLLLMPNGDLYAVGDKGLLQWKAGSANPTLVNPNNYFPKDRFRFFQSLNLDSQERILLGTGESGAIRWNPETDEITAFVHDENDINTVNSADVHYLFEDSNKTLWFGYHYLGISMMYFNSLDYTYTNIGEELGLEINLFNVSEDDKGNLWFGTDKGMIFKPSDGGDAKLYKPKENMNLRSSVFQNGKLFINADNEELGAIYTFDLSSRSFDPLLTRDSLWALPFPVETADHIFFPSSRRFVKINKRTEEISILSVPLNEMMNSKALFEFVQEDSEGALIADALYLENDLNIESFRYNPEDDSFVKLDVERQLPPNNRVMDKLARFDPMTIWSRDGYGIQRLNLTTGESVRYFEGESLIQENGTGSFIEDNEGYIWMNNATGIMRLDPTNETIAQYQIRKEYRPEAFLRSFIMNNGDIVFTGGVSGGFLRFNPEQAQVQRSVSNLLFLELKVNEQTYNPMLESLPASISFNDNDMAVSYLGLNYLDPTGTHYRYRIKGFSDSWTDVGGQRRVFLANLPSGNYDFEVQAASRYSGFDVSRSIQLSILPPWWLTWWAFTLYASLFGLFFMMIHRVQKARTIRKEREKNKDQQLAHAKEIEKAYNQLQETQKQLIHSEKMASLGELTAGIAHEIQNPLNFVNNFADINRELIEEQLEELEQGNVEDAKELAKDIQQNEEKIIHHGKRAEGIVKSMLLHSRGNEGAKELTDLNALCEEYLRLAFHGLRAKDRSFNSDFRLELDKQLPKVEVIPQDLGRVLLNLINNAFHAVKKVEKPEVVVSSKKNNGSVEIHIQDNGSGIPESLKEKIFQPFFTTKPTGEGTGLGLSMSYDIVTKGHNGKIEVESQEGIGTKFIISLPIH